MDENCQALIDPEVTPGFASNQITGPGVRYLVDGGRDLGFVSRYHSWRNKSQQWILHASEWKGWRQDQQVVVSPDVWNTNPFLHFIQIIWQSTKLILGRFQLHRLTNQSHSLAKLHFLKVTNRQGDQIARDFHVISESELALVIL